MKYTFVFKHSSLLYIIAPATLQAGSNKARNRFLYYVLSLSPPSPPFEMPQPTIPARVFRLQTGGNFGCISLIKETFTGFSSEKNINLTILDVA